MPSKRVCADGPSACWARLTRFIATHDSIERAVSRQATLGGRVCNRSVVLEFEYTLYNTHNHRTKGGRFGAQDVSSRVSSSLQARRYILYTCRQVHVSTTLICALQTCDATTILDVSYTNTLCKILYCIIIQCKTPAFQQVSTLCAQARSIRWSGGKVSALWARRTGVQSRAGACQSETRRAPWFGPHIGTAAPGNLGWAARMAAGP